MRKISEEIDNLLLQYLDGKLTGEKLEKIEQGIATSEELKDRLEVLKLIQSAMQGTSLLHPSRNFTNQVMNNLHRVSPTPLVTSKNGLLLLVGILIAIGIGASLVDAGFFNSLNGVLSFDLIELPSGVNTPAIPSIPFNGKLVVNAIITLNLALAFLLLDRFVLKPLFHGRSKMGV
jgi:hypothetical protein